MFHVEHKTLNYFPGNNFAKLRFNFFYFFKMFYPQIKYKNTHKEKIQHTHMLIYKQIKTQKKKAKIEIQFLLLIFL